MEKKIMPPKDEILLGVTEIYLDGEKITDSNPFGFSLDEPDMDNEPVYTNETYTFNGSVYLTDSAINALLTPKGEYDMICTEIDGLKYTFTNGKDFIKFELKEMTDYSRDIRIGSKYSFKFD